MKGQVKLLNNHQWILNCWIISLLIIKIIIGKISADDIDGFIYYSRKGIVEWLSYFKFILLIIEF